MLESQAIWMLIGMKIYNTFVQVSLEVIKFRYQRIKQTLQLYTNNVNVRMPYLR